MTPAQQQTLDALHAGADDFDSLMAITGLAHATIDRNLRDFHKQKLSHIVDWREGESGRLHAVWALGEGEDAPKPKTGYSRRAARLLSTLHRWYVADQGNPFRVLIAQLEMR